MSVQTEITRLENAKTAIVDAIAGKGVEVPDGTMLDGLAALIEGIEAGGGGGAKYTFGTFTLSSGTAADGYVIEHGLGLVPQIFILFPKYAANADYSFRGCAIWSEGIREAGYKESNYAYLFANRGVGGYTRDSLSTNSSLTVDENSITLPDFSLAILVNGIIHSWIAIGGISL